MFGIQISPAASEPGYQNKHRQVGVQAGLAVQIISVSWFQLLEFSCYPIVS